LSGAVLDRAGGRETLGWCAWPLCSVAVAVAVAVGFEDVDAAAWGREATPSRRVPIDSTEPAAALERRRD
jgi:hypothetical protein